MKIKRIVSLFLALVLALSAVAVLGSCKKSEKGITVQIGPNPETLDPALNSAVDGGNMLITLFDRLSPTPSALTVLLGPSPCVTA